MKECRYCKSPLKEEDIICTFCGYDHNKDAINPSFKPVKNKEKKAHAGRGVDPRVKKFAYIGLIITGFSIFYRYNFNINSMIFDIRNNLPKIEISKFITTIHVGKKDKKKNKEIEKIELIDVKSFKGPERTTRRKELKIEGIFFSPNSRNFVTINGEVLSEGESIERITIKKINRDSVEVVVDGQSHVLEVDQSIPLTKKD